jgi:hypothetical protein
MFHIRQLRLIKLKLHSNDAITLFSKAKRESVSINYLIYTYKDTYRNSAKMPKHKLQTSPARVCAFSASKPSPKTCCKMS